MQQICEDMYTYCEECHCRVIQSGIAGEFYLMICEYYVTNNEPIALYAPYFSEALRYLEISGYIVTSESGIDMLVAVPKTISLDDDETVICCSGNCSCDLLDFNTDTA